MQLLIKLRFSSLRHKVAITDFCYPVSTLCFIAPKTFNYLAFKPFDYERT